MSDIKVARLVKPGQPMEVGTIAKPEPGPKDVLIKVESCSIVPNTFNIVSGKALTDWPLALAPLVFGLDVSGVVESVGEHVLNLKEGDRVYVNPWITCDTCQACRQGKRDLCSAGALRGYFAMSEQGAKILQRYPIGGLSQYILSPDANVAVLPESIHLDTAARFGYIGTSFGALKKAQIGPASTVLINGVTGTLGYAAVAIALGLGATKILGVGRNPDRLKQISELAGANSSRIAVASSEEEKDPQAWVAKHTGGLGPDALIDCLGVGGDADMTLNLIKSVKRGGKAILVAGSAEGDVTQSYSEAMMRDVAIVGSTWFTNGEVDDLIALLSADIIDLSFLETKSFKLDQVNEAMEFVGDRPGGSINVVVKPNA